MVFHHSPPPPPPPPREPLPPLSPPPPPPQLPPRAFSSSFPLRWALGNRNRNAKSPRRFRFGRLPLPTTGGVNPVLRLGSSPLNPDRSNPFLNIHDPNPNHNHNHFAYSPPNERDLVEPVEGLENKSEDKGTNNLLVRLPVKKRNLSALCAEPETQPDTQADAVAEAEPEVKGNNNKGDTEVEEGEILEDDETIRKTWNLRPRRVIEKKTAVRAGRNGGGGGWMGNVSSRTRTRLRQQKEKGSKSGGLKGIKENNSGKKKEKEGVVLKKEMFSLTLKKEEIEEDFLKMTGAKPPKKPSKRPKAIQKQLDIIFPGLWLTRVTPESYQVPEPPLKG